MDDEEATVTGRTFYQRFEGSALARPDDPALEVGDAVLSYGELRTAALAGAARIMAVHGRLPDRVALVGSRTVAAYAGYLAVQRLGACVVPLNPQYPAQRNLDIAQRARVEVALVAPEAVDLFLELPRRHRPTLLPLDDLAPDGSRVDGIALPPVPADTDREAFVLFTSGSTGQPKGVPIRQRNFSPHLAHTIPRYEIGPGSRLSGVFGLTFDAHAFDLFATWGGGGTLVVPSAAELYRPVDFIVERKLTHWFSVPSVVQVAQQLGNLPLGRATGLRHSIFGAEPVTLAHARLWRAVAPHTRIHNVYGPTELSLTCTEYTLPGPPGKWPCPGNGTVPIGVMYPHLEGVVLGEDGRPAAEGELCVRGTQRFDGYLDPHENTGRFVSYEAGGVAEVYDGSTPLTPAHWYRTGDRVRWEDWDGPVMVHGGRLDQQVKIMGHRVEIGEVEAVVRRHPGVLAAAVIACPRDGDTQLAAAYCGPGVPVAELDAWLRTQLPPHMVPARLRHLNQLPLNDNGKTDRRRLTALLGGEDG